MKRINIKKMSLLFIMMLPQIVLAEDYAYRGKELKVVYIIGVVLLAIRIAVPILLMVIASIDLVKALVQNDDSEMKKALKGIVPKVIIAISILTLPTLLLLILKLTNNTGLFSEYSKCLLRPSSCSVQMFEEPPEIEETSSRDHIVIDQPEITNYDGVDYSKFKWRYYDRYQGPINSYYSESYPYAIWAPEDASDLNGASLPLLIWLHGAGEMREHNCLEECFFSRGLPPIITNWSETGLKQFPAIIIAPQMDSSGWYDDRSIETVKSAVEYAQKEYNIDRSRVVLMGHSSGGSGVVFVARKTQDLFSALVIMSGFGTFDGYEDYFKKVPMKGYMTSNPATAAEGGDGSCGMKRVFASVGRSDDLYIFPKNVKHVDVPKAALTLDENKDGESDLVNWMFKLDSVSEHESQEPSEPVSPSDPVTTDSGTLKMYFLAYGRYDSYLIVGNGSTIFIDGGYEYGGTLSVRFMKQLGITKIDALIGSHLDNNHVDAHKKIINELEVSHVYYPDDPNTCVQNKTCKGGNSADPTKLAKLIKDKNIPLTVLTPGKNIKIGNLTFDCVGPQTVYTTQEHYYSDNYNSLNLILKFGNNKFYFSGDGIQEDEILPKYGKETLDVDLFKYPHHGQQVSGEKTLSVDFAKVLSPKYVMIPNTTNYLEKDMKKALEEMGAEVILTGTGGNTLVESDGNNITITRDFNP